MQAPRRTHPLVIVAAGTVSLFSLVGIGAVMGWIPTSVGNQGSATIAQVPPVPEQTEPVKPVEQRPAPKPAAKSEHPREAPRAFVAPPPTSPVVVAAVC